MRSLFFLFILIASKSVFSATFETLSKRDERISPDPKDYEEVTDELSLNEIRVSDIRITYPKGCPSLCPLQTVQVSDRCYRFIDAYVPWLEAKKDCEGQGGILAIPNFMYNNTAVDLAAVYRTIIGVQAIWIGASDAHSKVEWWWVDGNKLPITHPNWYPNNPAQDNNCAAIYRMVKGPLQIIEKKCLEKRPFLCQFKFLNES